MISLPSKAAVQKEIVLALISAGIAYAFTIYLKNKFDKDAKKNGSALP